MHETSLVAELIEECERRAHGRQVGSVVVRHASSLDDTSLRELFAALAAGGPLERATLEAETFDVQLECSECGWSGTVDDDHVYGHVRVCPECGAVSDDAGTAELELVDVVIDS
jgi:Zn finger protein HypA/HybF involved in hydrogenase expression